MAAYSPTMREKYHAARRRVLLRCGAERNATAARVSISPAERGGFRLHEGRAEDLHTAAVTREFCAVCGTHMITRRPGRRKASRSILLRTACPPSTACRRDNSSNQPRRWHCSERSAKGAGTTD